MNPRRSRCSAEAGSGAPGGARRRSGIAALALAGAALLAASTMAPAPGRAQYPNPGPPSQPDSPPPGTSQDRPRFSVDATVQPGTGMPTVRFDYRLARAELLFERRATGYHAAYELRVLVYPENDDDRQVTGDVFVRDLTVTSYAETRPQGADIIDNVELPVPPGKYAIQVVVNDLVAERMSGTVIPLQVPAQPADPVWFTDLAFGTAAGGATAGAPTGSGGLRAMLVPNPSRRYAQNLPALAVFGEIVDARPDAERGPTYHIEYRVRNEVHDRVAQKDTVIARQGGRTPFLLRPGIASLTPGTYRFAVELKAPLPAAAARGRAPAPRREKTFEVSQSSASVAADPRGSLDLLRLIAERQESEEMDRLRTEEERRLFWESFWKRRDPSPDTAENEEMDEFYRRVQYANQHFGIAGPGWRTDMGRTYIKYGRPDEVVRSPFNLDRPPEEVWYYYRERKTFVFVDKDGFGRYELDPNRSS